MDMGQGMLFLWSDWKNEVLLQIYAISSEHLIDSPGLSPKC